MAELTAEELAAAQAKAPDAKRFEKVETEAGTLILRNATRAQVNATRAQQVVRDGMTLKDAMTPTAGLICAMCVQPGPEALKTLMEDWPQLDENEDVKGAVARLNGAAKKT